MQVLVIGGMGFLGAAIVREIRARGDDVTVGDRSGSPEECRNMFGEGVSWTRMDILDEKSLRHAFRGMDEIYHLAGLLGTSELVEFGGKVEESINVNILGAIKVFEIANECEVSRVFYPSKPNPWINTYSITKSASEQFSLMYTENGNVPIRSLRYFNAYGPEQHLYPVRKIVPTFAIQAMNNLPIEIYGNGEQIVDMIYSTDLARITVDFLRNMEKNHVCDLGTGKGISVNEVAESVNNYFGNKAGLKHVEMRIGEVPDTKLISDNSLIRDVLGDLEFTAWDIGLEETLKWYESLSNQEVRSALNFYGM